jgi:hypothetical protein
MGAFGDDQADGGGRDSDSDDDDDNGFELNSGATSDEIAAFLKRVQAAGGGGHGSVGSGGLVKIGASEVGRPEGRARTVFAFRSRSSRRGHEPAATHGAGGGQAEAEGGEFVGSDGASSAHSTSSSTAATSAEDALSGERRGGEALRDGDLPRKAGIRRRSRLRGSALSDPSLEK